MVFNFTLVILDSMEAKPLFIFVLENGRKLHIDNALVIDVVKCILKRDGIARYWEGLFNIML